MKKIKPLLIIIITFLTGCNYRELNELAIGNVLGIDYENNQYEITVQVLDLKKAGESNESETSVIYQSRGETIPTAIRNTFLSNPKELYLGHLELVVLGKGVKDMDTQELLDYFIRTPEIRNDFKVLLAPNNKANEILAPKDNKEESFPSDEIINTINNSMRRQGTAVDIDMEKLISTYLQKGIDPVLTTIENTDENDEYQLTGIMALSDKSDESVKLSKEEAIAYNILNENFLDIIITTKYKDSNLDIVIIKPKSSIEGKVNENNISFDINVSANVQISEIREIVNLEDQKYQKEIEETINKTIKNYIKSLINTCKEHNIDVLGLKNNIYKRHNKYYENYKEENIYEISDININVVSKAYRYGNIYRSTKGE